MGAGKTTLYHKVCLALSLSKTWRIMQMSAELWILVSSKMMRSWIQSPQWSRIKANSPSRELGFHAPLSTTRGNSFLQKIIAKILFRFCFFFKNNETYWASGTRIEKCSASQVLRWRPLCGMYLWYFSCFSSPNYPFPGIFVKGLRSPCIEISPASAICWGNTCISPAYRGCWGNFDARRSY